MNIVEIILLAGGIGVFIASYFVGNKKEDKESVVIHDTELSEDDKAKIKEQVDSIIQDKMEDVSEQAEAKMDKISNTKILELNDYAETIMSEINRNHNETVFLYDMLNEKAKEVKNTVKDVNIAKKEVNRIAAQQVNVNNDTTKTQDSESVKTTDDSRLNVKNNTGLNNQIDSSLYSNINKAADNNDYGYKAPEGSKDLAKERLMEIVKSASKPADDAKTDEKASTTTKSGAETTATTKTATKTAAKKTTTKSTTAKTATKTTAKTTAKTTKTAAKAAPKAKAEDIVAGFDESMTNSERIVELSKQGISNKEIAKVLNVALGEVKLIVDLHNSNSSD